jgi:hypothetical protein
VRRVGAAWFKSGGGPMAKKKATDPVEVAYQKFLAIYDGLTQEQQVLLDERIVATIGVLSGLKFEAKTSRPSKNSSGTNPIPKTSRVTSCFGLNVKTKH